MSDLADSGQIERDADTIGLLHFPKRDAEPEKAALVIAKQRDGSCSAIPLRWNPAFVRFEETSPIQDEDVPPMDVPDNLN